MAALFFDLNKFKTINDTFGHAAGDEVLKIFSQCLLDGFRNSDVIARLGGDEFCVLCTHLSENNIDLLLRRFQDSINNRENLKYPIEFSVGHIIYDANHHQSLSDLLAEADTKMYEDKKKKNS